MAIPVVIDALSTAAARVAEAAASGAEMIELRADRASPEALAAALDARGSLAAIVTIRPTWEGGEYDGDEATRMRLFELAFVHAAEFVDVELAAWEARRSCAPRCRSGCRRVRPA